MNRFLIWILGGIGFVYSAPLFGAMVLVDWLEERKKKVPAPLRSAGPSAEESERPFPGPVIEHGALADREHGRKVYAVRLATREEQIAAANAAMDRLKVRALIRDAGGC